MPTFRHGRGTRVFFDEEELSAYLREASVAVTVDTAETSAFGTFDKTYITGMIAGTARMAGMFDGSVDAVDAELAGVLGAEAQGVLTIYQEDATVIGSRCSLVGTLGTSYEVSSPVGDVVAVSAEFQGSNMTRQGINLHNANTGETGTSNSTSVDNAAATTQGGVAHLHVYTNTRNGTGVIKVQHSVDNSVWVDLVTFATVGATTKTQERVIVPRGTTVNRYLRGQWAIAGSTGSTIFALSFARNLA